MNIQVTGNVTGRHRGPKR